MQEPAELQSGKPFNKPTDICVCPKTGDLFITGQQYKESIAYIEINDACAINHIISKHVVCLVCEFVLIVSVCFASVDSLVDGADGYGNSRVHHLKGDGTSETMHD